MNNLVLADWQSDLDREDLEIWLKQFHDLQKHPSTGQRTDEIRKETQDDSNRDRQDLK